MRKQLLMLAAFTVAATVASHASLVWTGAADGNLWNEANWLDNDGLVPVAGTINTDTHVTAATGGLIEINGTIDTFHRHFYTGLGNALLISGGTTLASTSTGGMKSLTAAVSASIIEGSTVYIQFCNFYDWTLDGGSLLKLKGGGTPFNDCTLDFLDTSSILQFDAETYADFTAEHAGQITAFGVALDFGADPYAAETGDNAIVTDINGGAGVQIMAIPEPATLGMVALCGGGILFIRRRLMI